MDDATAAVSPRELRVVLVDEHPVFRIGMAVIIESLPGLVVAAQAVDAGGIVASLESCTTMSFCA